MTNTPHKMSQTAPGGCRSGRSAWRTCGLLLAALMLLPACGSLPKQAEMPESRSMAPRADSPLVALARASTPAPALSGFRLLPLGVHSLDARLQLIDRARQAAEQQASGGVVVEHVVLQVQRVPGAVDQLQPGIQRVHAQRQQPKARQRRGGC